MPLVVNTNVMSLNAQRHLAMNTNSLSKSLEKLASGYRINRAADDAAGLQLSENLRSQIRGSEKALANVQDGINMLNIADGAMDQITQNLQRVRELAVQAANDTYSPDQRAAIVSEIEQLLQDNDRIADSTQFNGVNLLNDQTPTSLASGGTGLFIQLGANDDATNDRVDIATVLGDLTSDGILMVSQAGPPATDGWLDPDGQAGGEAELFDGTNLVTNDGDDTTALGTEGDNVIDDNTEAQVLIGVVDQMITGINGLRGDLGAMVNRLEGAATNLMTSIENLSSSESRIRNVDVAAESAEMVRSQILQQSAATVLAQANQAPSLALSLLGG